MVEHSTQSLTPGRYEQVVTKIIKKFSLLEEHSTDVISVVVGNILGDGHLRKENISTHLCLTFSDKHFEYANFIRNFYASRGYCSTKELVCRPTKQQVNGKIYHSIRFSTYSFKSFNLLHSIFYRKATDKDRDLGRGNERFIKVVPENIEEYLTPQALAIWFMDDGTFSKKDQTARLYTDNFTKEGVELLSMALQKYFIQSKSW